MAEFETLSTSSLQIRVKKSSCQQQRNPVLRSSSMRQSRLDDSGLRGRPPTKNTLSVHRATNSRSLSPRPPSSYGEIVPVVDLWSSISSLGTHSATRPPPPSPSGSGLLPTRSPTPPLQVCKDTLRVPGVANRGQLTPRSLSSRCAFMLIVL